MATWRVDLGAGGRDDPKCGRGNGVSAIFMATLLAAAATHRVVRLTPLRHLAPNWESWERGKKFPMGFALGPTLAIYLILGALYGA